MKKNIFTIFLLIAFWGMYFLFYNYINSNPSTLDRYGKEMTFDFLDGTLYTVIIYSVFLLSLRLFDWFPKKYRFIYGLIHSLFLFSPLLWIYLRFDWSFPIYYLLIIFVTFPLFTHYGFHSKYFLYGTILSYILILFFFNNQYQDEKLDYFTRIFFMVSSWANENVLHLSFIAPIIGIVLHFLFTDRPKNRRRKQRQKKTAPTPTPTTDDYDAIF